MKEKNERPDQKKTKKKKNKTAIDCRCLYLLTYKFNTIKNLGLFYLCIVLTEDSFYNNVTYNIIAFFDNYKETKKEKWCTRMF